MAIERHGTTQRDSDLCAYGNTIYLVDRPQTLDANAATQMREVLAGVEKLLAQAGSDKTRLLMVTIYLRDIEDAVARTPSGTAGYHAERPRAESASKRSCVIATFSLKSRSSLRAEPPTGGLSAAGKVLRSPAHAQRHTTGFPGARAHGA